MQAVDTVKMTDFSELSSQNSGKKTYVQAAAQAKTNNRLLNSPNTANAENQDSNNLARSQFRTQSSTKISKKIQSKINKFKKKDYYF